MTIYLQSTIIFLMLILLVAGPSTAIKAQGVDTGNLSESLEELKGKVQTLELSNQAIVFKNGQLKAGLKNNEIHLQKLVQDNQQLEQQKMKLQQEPSSKTSQINEVKNKEDLDLDRKMTALNEELKAANDAMAAVQKQDNALNRQIEQLSKPGSVPSDDPSMEITELAEQKQKTKLALLKMVSESHSRQLLLNEKILDYQKKIPQAPGASNNENKKEILQAKIERLQKDLVRLNTEHNQGPQKNLNEENLRELESNVNDLEKNKDELKVLLMKMQQKTQQVKEVKDGTGQKGKILSNISQLNLETRNLKIDLAELQQQMVVLDKRKSHMESLLKN